MRATALAAITVLTLTACSPSSPTVENAAIETAVSLAGDRAVALGRSGDLSPQGVTVMVGVTDSFGQKTQAPALRFTWSASDLTRVSWPGMNGYTTLDLSRPEILSRYGAQALGSWCIDPQGDSGRTLTPNLCQAPYERAAADFMTGKHDSSSAVTK